MHPQRPLAWLAGLGLVGLLIGCNKSDSANPPANNPQGTVGQVQGPGGQFQGPGGQFPGPGGPGGGMKVETGPFTGGKQVFATSGCVRCHTINGARLVASGGAGGPPFGGPRGPMGGGPGFGGRGPGGPGGFGRGRQAPDLGKVGKDPKHTVEWFMTYIRDPRSVDPDSRMPPQRNVKDEDLRALAEYLQTLK